MGKEAADRDPLALHTAADLLVQFKQPSFVRLWREGKRIVEVNKYTGEQVP